MRFRTTLILVFILAVLGLTFWMWPEVEEDDAGEVERLFPDFTRESAVQLAIRRAGGEELVIERQDGGAWRITRPFPAEADDELIDQVLRDLETGYRYEEPRPGLPADYGLAEPRLVLTFQIEDGEEHRIAFGRVDSRRKNASEVFVQLDGADTIHRTQRSLFETLNRQSDELRERSVVPSRLLDVHRVRRVEIRQGDRALVLRQIAGQWEIEEPVVAAAEMPTVRTLIATMLNLQIDRFVADRTADLAEYGLADPRGRVVLSSGDGPEDVTVTLLVGSDDPEREGNVFVSLEGMGSVYSVIDDQGSLKPDVTEMVRLTAGDLRDPRIFGAIRYASERLEVEGPGELHWVLEQEGLGWKVTEPIERAADEKSVGQLLDRLDLAKFESFLPDASEELAEHGLAEPAVTIRLTHGDPARTTVVHLSEVRADGRFVLREGPDTVGRVELGTFDYLDNGFWPYIARPFWDLEEDDVLGLTVEVGDGERAFTRGEEGWQTGPVPVDVLEAVLERLVSLAGDAVYERQPEQGLEDPVARVTLKTADGQEVLLVGEKMPRRDELRFAARESAPEAKTIPADLLDELRVLVR